MSMSKSHHREKQKGPPPLFSHIGKEAGDLLKKGFGFNQQFSIKTYSDHTGLAITSSTLRRHGRSSGNVSIHYKYNNTAVDVELNTRSPVLTRLTFKDILPRTNIIALYQLPNYHELAVQQNYEYAALEMVLVVKESPEVKLLASVGGTNIAFGVKGKYNIAKSLISEYNAAFSLKQHNREISVSLADKGDLINASFMQHIDWYKKITGVVEITHRLSTYKNTLTVGASCSIDRRTLVKAKINNMGILVTLIEHRILKRSYFTLTGQFDTNAFFDKAPRIGLALALKL